MAGREPVQGRGSERLTRFAWLVPGNWTVQRGHALVEDVERDIRTALGTVTVPTHLEPREDPRAWEDIGLDREANPPARTASS